MLGRHFRLLETASFGGLRTRKFRPEIMDKLANYGSDDDYDDSPQHKRTEYRSNSDNNNRQAQLSRQAASEADVNYEEVQMDLSEDSSSDSSRDDSRLPAGGRRCVADYDRSKRTQQQEKHAKEDARVRDSPKSYRSKREEDDDKYYRAAAGSDDRGRDSERERYKDKGRDDKCRDKYRDDKTRDSRDRYRDDRRSKRSSSRERQRSRSPRRPDYRNRRSDSRERPVAKSGYARRFDRASNKMAQLEKLGIEIKTPDCQFMSPSDLQRSMEDQKRKGESENRFFMPGITGRFREQIERRKMLWQKKEPEKKDVGTSGIAGGTSVGRVWETTTFAQDSDGKVANKFKRLMGIRGSPDESKPTTDVLKKQEEMFSSMEAQYEVARTATHTMRGVGLGFGSFQR